MNKLYPQGDTPESLEGTAAHWVFEQMLLGEVVAEGQIAPNGVVLTEEMLDGGELMVEVVRARTGLTFYPIEIEQLTAIPRIHAECWGTPDVWAISKDARTLEVIDYKFGHRFVDEFENDQLVAYVAGIIDKAAQDFRMGAGALDQMLTANITVVQPRCFYKGSPVRTWTVKASDLRPQVNHLMMAAEAALAPNPVATTNSECRNCPGRHACPALQKAAYADAETSVKSAPVDLLSRAASLELKFLERALDRLGARVEGLREQVTAFAKGGDIVPWHKLEQGYANQRWTVPTDQVLAMGQLMGADLAKPGVLTPKQAVKIGIDEAVIKAYSMTPLGSLKLVSDNPADVRRTFTQG